MAYTPEQLSDRAEIVDLVTRYAWAIDTQDWELFRSLFTPGARLDYSSNPGGVAGTLDEVLPWLQDNMAAFVVMQHLMANTDVHLDGDRATARTMLVNPMGARTEEGPPHFFWVGGRYDDECVRTADGWRIATRVETLLWLEGTLPPRLLKR
jgi:3-phenylpropionate/cinnamic acid dioxygenase small subunit